MSLFIYYCKLWFHYQNDAELAAAKKRVVKLENQIQIMGKELEALRLKLDRQEEVNRALAEANKGLTQSLAVVAGSISQKIDKVQGMPSVL